MQNRSYHNPNKKTNNECPTCGWQIGHSHTFEQGLFGQFSNEKNGDFTAYRSTPVRGTSLEADVLVPLAQSLISSVGAIISAIPLSIWLGFEWPIFVLIWAASFLAAWLSAIKRSEFSIAKTEEFSYSANEKEVGAIAGQGRPGPLQMEVIHSSGGIRNQMQILDLPDQITEVDFAKFLRDILAGRSLARKDWAGTDKPFSRDGYDGMIDKLLAASIIQPSVKGGKILSNGGKHAIARMVREGLI